jgi:hypothetical protein
MGEKLFYRGMQSATPWHTFDIVTGMNTSEIIRTLDEEISRLQRIRQLLSTQLSPQKRRGRPPGSANKPKSTTVKSAPNKAKPAKKTRKLTAEGRERIAAAQRARWAKLNNAAKKGVANKSAARKTAAKKTNTKKTAAKKVVVKKVAAKREPVKRIKKGAAKAPTALSSKSETVAPAAAPGKSAE